MVKRKTPKSWAEEVAELDDPALQGTLTIIAASHYNANGLDFDPEENVEDAVDNPEDSSYSSDNESQKDAREHYEDVGYIIRGH